MFEPMQVLVFLSGYLTKKLSLKSVEPVYQSVGPVLQSVPLCQGENLPVFCTTVKSFRELSWKEFLFQMENYQPQENLWWVSS